MAETTIKIDFGGTKQDELDLLELLTLERPEPNSSNFFASDYAERLGIHWKRCQSLLLKWTDRRWWEYGVSARSGWFTELGLEAAR
jgi:hypothetical protein